MIIAKGRVRLRVWLVLGAVAALALLGGAWLWLRDSPLAAVKRVTVTGLSGPDAGQIRSALDLAARNMTTLDVHLGQLRTAVAPYPVVRDLKVSTQFPHGMRIRVIEQLPVGALVAGGETIAASADGTLLHDVPAGSLPTVPIPTIPGGSRATDQTALNALALLAATPRRLEPKISQVTTSSTRGLVVQLRSGPVIYFGPPSGFGAKWSAAVAVLAAPASAGASYIDVSDPAMPAAGVGAQALPAAGLATNASQTSGSTSEGTSASQTSTPSPGA
ncbi:MAG TPA: FtsQ-type POTRA domain-containing protein [Solirubrobacteraceae bacterium]|nr:FtsQ-type POTRA domain-containing protein [Solirubrobacteraceae bacterium]